MDLLLLNLQDVKQSGRKQTDFCWCVQMTSLINRPGLFAHIWAWTGFLRESATNKKVSARAGQPMLSTLRVRNQVHAKQNCNRPLGPCQQGERLRRFDCSPFKSQTANRAYENENHKAVVSSQRPQTVKTVPIANGVAITGGSPRWLAPLKRRRMWARPSAIHPSARRSLGGTVDDDSLLLVRGNTYRAANFQSACRENTRWAKNS